MNSLQIIDVFESYYEGRSAPFPTEGKEAAAAKREDKPSRPVKPSALDETTLPRAA
jgi:hypothetical protein